MSISAGSAGSSPVRYVTALAIPLGLLALAYGLWWLSDRLLYIGPLDRAAFGWLIVIPLWFAAPLAAGLVWQKLDRPTVWWMAVLLGVAISIVAAVLIWRAVAFPNCETGSLRTPQEMLVPAVLVGATLGAGMALSGLLTAAYARRGQPVAAVVLGVGATAVVAFVTFAVMAGLGLLGPACQRPL